MTNDHSILPGIKRAFSAFMPVFVLILTLSVIFFGFSPTATAESSAADATFSSVSEAQKKARISLTLEERQWLKANAPIRLATLTNQPPFSMMAAGGSHSGMLAEILALLSKAIGQQIEPRLVENAVSDTHAVAKQNGIFGSASILNTSRHANEYLLTDPYYMTPYYIYTTTASRNEIRLPADLKGKRVAVPRNHRAVEGYLAGIGGVQMVFVDTPLEQMRMVVAGEADALIGYFTYPYLVNKYLMVDLVMAFVAKSDQGIHIGVNPELLVLHGILNKAIASLDVLTINAIAAKWMEVSKEKTPRLELTPEEQAWLKAHPEIVLGAPTDYPPMVIKRKDGTHVGVLVDFFELVSKCLNSKIRLHIEDSWGDVQKKAQNREIDGLAVGGIDPSRAAIYNPTDALFPTYFSVFGRSPGEYQVKRFTDLDGMRIGYKKAARPTRSLLEKLPSATLMPYGSHESMTQALLSKEIDVIVAWMSYDHWRKQKMQGTIDNVLIIEEHPIEMVSHIRKDWPELIPIFNKAIFILQKDELPRLINKWFGEWPQQLFDRIISLTPEEQTWLAQNKTVRVRAVDYPPYQIIKGNEAPHGIAIEYLKLIQARSGINFQYELTNQPFSEFLASMKQGQGPDMTALIQRTPEREAYLSFTAPYLSSPYVLFTREEDDPIFDIQELIGKTLAIPRGFFIQELLSRDYPEIKQVLFDSDEKALHAVATGQADAYIGSLTVASHIIHKQGLSDLKVAAPTPFKEQSLAMGVRSDWPELRSILDKALASISEEEQNAIRNKYLAIEFEPGINKAEALKWVLIVGGAVAGIMLVFFFWNRRLVTETSKRKDAEKRLLTTFDNMPIAAVMIDHDDSMYLHNKRFLELFGYTLDDIPHLADWWVKAYPDEQYRKWVIETWNACLQRSIETGENIEAKEYKVTCKNGDVRDMEISGHFLGDRYLATLIDNTERNRANDELRKAKDAAEAANQAKSMFLASMSHELRTPLNAILGFSRMLAQKSNATVDEKEKLSIINRSGQHLLAMINDILDLSKIEAGRIELQKNALDLVALTKEISVMIQSRASEKGLSVAVGTESVQFPYIETDVGKLRQILINLLTNAVKFTDEGGVTIRCATEAIPEEETRGHIVIEVEDTGPGIEPARIEKIFEPFVQGIDAPARKGTGLGLSICKKYADFMGGTIEVESEVGQGALFRVRLPAKVVEAADMQPPVDDQPRVIGMAPAEKTWRILVADDNPENRLLLKSLLEEVGLLVIETENGKEAVAAFERESPDFIWMDMRMPVMDGYEAVRQIRQCPGGDTVAIVAITASAFKEQKQDILASGCDDMVTKPFQAHEIFEAMARHLDMEYIYEAESEAAPVRVREVELTTVMLADLPNELLQKLREATLALNREAAFEVIAHIADQAPEVAAILKKLVANYQMAELQDLIGISGTEHA